MDNLESMCPSELIIIGTLAAFLISDDLDAGQLNVLGNFIVSIGSFVLTWAAQKEFLKSSQETKNPKQNITAEDIKKHIQYIQEELSKKTNSPS